MLTQDFSGSKLPKFTLRVSLEGTAWMTPPPWRTSKI